MFSELECTMLYQAVQRQHVGRYGRVYLLDFCLPTAPVTCIPYTSTTGLGISYNGAAGGTQPRLHTTSVLGSKQPTVLAECIDASLQAAHRKSEQASVGHSYSLHCKVALAR